jgi:hypothetical protein
MPKINLSKILIMLVLLWPDYSCRKLKNYFREPDTEVIIETLHSAVLTGYAANVAMAVIAGHSVSNVTASRSNAGFPCTTLMVVDLSSGTDLPVVTDKASAITIAGLWPNETTAILTLLFTDFHTASATLELVGIETIPVIREDNDIHVALASMDVKLNPDQESILQLNLTTFEVESELLRLESTRPTDVYVAVTQDVYYINVNNNGTMDDPADDAYSVTGGGQLVEVANNSAEIMQQALVDVLVSPACATNPLAGMALIKATGVESEGFPEMGTALLEFTDECDGTAHVFVATGMYVTSNGQEVSFHL